MSLEETKEMSQGILGTMANFHAQEIPNEIFAETESFRHESAAINQSENFNDFHALIDSVIGEIGIDYDHFDIFKYIDPGLDPLRDDGMDCLINKIHSDLVALKSKSNISVDTTTQSCMVPVEDNQKPTENNARKMLARPVQPLNTLQSEIKQHKTNSQLQEELIQWRQLNSQLQEELNRFKAIQKKVEQQTHPQVEQVSAVDKPMHEIDAQGGITTVNNLLPLSSSGLLRKRRRGKLQRYSNESMQQHTEINEENIVSQSKSIRMIASGAQEDHQVVKPTNKRPATRNLRPIAKKTRRCSPRRRSQVNVHQENRNINDAINGDCHDDEDREVDSDEDDIGASLELKSKKRNYRYNIRGNGLSKKDTTMEQVRLKNGNRYVCDVNNCNLSFASASGLNYHKLIHAGLKPYNCNECNRSFRQKNHLSEHMMTHTGVKPHLCKMCNKSFRQQHHLSDHLKIHTGEKPHLCKVCNKSFRQKIHLSEHLKIHTGEKPHLCNVCNTSFRHKNTLSDHLKIHTGEKPHLCTVCNKSFRQKIHLSVHSKICTGEKSHLCKVCNRLFRQKNHLSNHVKIHTEEKLHLGSKMSLRSQANVSRNSNICVGKKQYERQRFSCDYCGQKFSNKTYLKSHCLKCNNNRLGVLTRSSN